MPPSRVNEEGLGSRVLWDPFGQGIGNTQRVVEAPQAE